MRYQEALIAWTPGTDRIKVGPLIQLDGPDWTGHPSEPNGYRYTGGAAYTWLRDCKDKTLRDLVLFIEFHSIVVRDRVPVEAAHRAFLAIDEYRERIAPDISGAAPIAA
jgi:hypothetical protein